MSGKTKILTTAALAAAVFIAISAATIIVASPWSAGPTAAANHGLAPGPVPPWVNPDGTIDIDKVPDRMPVSDRNGNMVGYMPVDKNPNDDPNPGDPGFEEWNYGPIQVTNESGELVGHMQSVSPGGIQMFEPLTSTAVNENGQGGSGASPE